MTNDILTVRVVSKDGGDYLCRCPHCGEIMTTDATELMDVRGQQYQHRIRTSYGTAGCDGWLEIADDARRVAILPPKRTAHGVALPREPESKGGA